MKIASFNTNAGSGFGIVKGDGIIDVGSRINSSLLDVLGNGNLGQLAGHTESDADFGLDGISFQPPVPNPGKIVCIGVNYGRRNEEYKDGKDLPQNPSVFMRTPESLVGHRQPILRPPESEKLDYEGEIVLVIGKKGRRIGEESATSHVAGVTLMNEGSVRDWMRHGKFNVTQGKNFASSGSCGPWLVTLDEAGDLGDMEIQTKVNGELRQSDRTSNLIFSFSRLISYLSVFMTLMPGDIIATGTPIGSGARHEPPLFLKQGDVVEVISPAIGRLENEIVDE